MNPQFIAPQPGAPPNFQINRTSPSLGPPSSRTFQNVPLGGSDSGQDDLPPTNLKSSPFPPSTIGGPAGRPLIPSSQLPPSQRQDENLMANNPFNQSIGKPQNLPPVTSSSQVQNGPLVFQNGSGGIELFIKL